MVEVTFPENEVFFVACFLMSTVDVDRLGVYFGHGYKLLSKGAIAVHGKATIGQYCAQSI